MLVVYWFFLHGDSDNTNGAKKILRFCYVSSLPIYCLSPVMSDTHDSL